MEANRTFAAAVLTVAVSILACSTLTPPNRNPPTPTPTGQIGAIEVSTPSDKKDWEVWTGTITSQTLREFVVNGSVARTCTTNWTTDVDFGVDGSGNLHGAGQATLSQPRICTPAGNIVDNTQGMKISVAGKRLAGGFDVKLGVTEFQPPVSGDFGGYMLLLMDGTCPGQPRDLSVAFSSSTTAEAQLDLHGILTGCGGSQNDTMSNKSLVKLQYRFRCSQVPADLNDPSIDQLCH